MQFLYRCTNKYAVAGILVEKGSVIKYAPIFRNWWKSKWSMMKKGLGFSKWRCSLISVLVTNFEFQNKKITFKSPQEFMVQENEIIHSKWGVRFSYSSEETIESEINDFLKMLWVEYVEEKEDKLSESAKNLRNILQESINRS